jgi:hypothetical protein
MKVKPLRLLSDLQHEHFQLARVSAVEDSFAFVRGDTLPDLYQWIWIQPGGKRGEAVLTYLAVSVAKWIALKGLMETKLMSGIGEDPERGWTIVDSEYQARKLEQRLVQLAPSAVAEFAATHGSDLLAQTEAARKAANKYLSCIESYPSAEAALGNLRAISDETTVDEADRIMNWTAMRQLAGCPELYEIACLCLLNNSARVEGTDVAYFGQDPLENIQLMWRIQLIVDKLYTRFGNQPA